MGTLATVNPATRKAAQLYDVPFRGATLTAIISDLLSAT